MTEWDEDEDEFGDLDYDDDDEWDEEEDEEEDYAWDDEEDPIELMDEETYSQRNYGTFD
jgi:hypothetical protein